MRIRALFAAAGLVAGLAVALPSPAHAHRDVCLGTGFIISAPFQYPVISAANGGPIDGQFGLCVSSGLGATVNGNLYGHCGNASGLVYIDGHGPSDMRVIGSMVFVGATTGSVIGTGQMWPAPGQSCLPPSSTTQWQLSLAVVTL